MKIALIIIMSLILLKWIILIIVNIIGHYQYKDNYLGLNRVIKFGTYDRDNGFSIFPCILLFPTCNSTYFEIYIKWFRLYVYICYTQEVDKDE